MRNIFKVVPLFVSLGLIVACVETESAKVEMPKMEELDILKALTTCSKKESEVNFSQAALDNSYDVRDLVESKDIEFIDCDGKVSSRGHGPVRRVTKILKVPAPADLPESVNFIEMSNPRSCTKVRVSGSTDQSDAEESDELSEATKIFLLGSVFRRGEKGAVTSVVVSDSNMRFSNHLNIKDGSNPVTIRFFGKCLRYRMNKEKDAGDHVNCEEAKLLATQEITVNLKVTRPRVDGVIKQNICTEKN